jgi:NTE family protein
VNDSPAAPRNAAFARLFAAAERDGEARAFSLPGGTPLFLVGEPADDLYMLAAGRLMVKRDGGNGTARTVGSIQPGDLVGEMALIAGTPHTADVVALRDCEMFALPRATLLKAAENDPDLMIELARLVVARGREDETPAAPGSPSAFGFIGLTVTVDARALAEAVAREIRGRGSAVAVAGGEARGEEAAWFSRLERAHDVVIYAAEAREEAWSAQVARQADRLIRIGDGALEPPPPPRPPPIERETDLVLVHAADCAAPRGAAIWRTALSPSRLLHLRASNGADIARLARALTGRAVGLTLSGGGARAYAHIGVIRALEGRGVPIDFVCGASLGAIIAAGLAMGWALPELEARIRKAFVETSPLDDIAVPLIAMTRGGKVRARMAEHFGERDIADLWLPFFCVSSNLTAGVSRMHEDGLLREALTASVSLPGVLPPVIVGADVLVDGALMNNFPAHVMRRGHAGPIVGVDVGRGRSIDASDLTPRSVWRWIRSGEWRKGPPIVSLLMRAATVSGGGDLAAARAATDVLIVPDVDAIEIRDWKAYDAAVAVGERAASETLGRLTVDVTELRQAQTTLS